MVSLKEDKSRQAHAHELESHQLLASNWVKAQAVVGAYIMSVLRDSHQTEDVLQEVARVAVAKIGEYDPTRSFTRWVLGIAKYEILRERRNCARSRVYFSDELLENLASGFAAEAASPDIRKEALRQCLQDVAGRKRRVLEMRYQRDLKPADIAERLGVTSNAILLLLSRTRRWLAKCVGGRVAQDAV